MISKLKELGKDELVRGGITLFVLMNIFNFLNYLFQFFMIRFLGPADYGVLAVLMSIIYIFAIPSEAVQTISAKYTSRFNVKKEYGKIKEFLFKSMKKGFFLSTILFALFIPLSFLLSSFLKIPVSLLIITGFLIFYSILFPILRGILQGQKKFRGLGLNMNLESLIKLVLGVILVLGGFRVYGALGGIIVGGIVAFIFVFFYLKEITKSKRETEKFDGIYSYSWTVFIAMIAIVLMYSLDVILAKRFFSPEVAGQYAVISMMGKIILFGTYSIGKAMFPMTTENHESGKDSFPAFVKSLKLGVLLSGAALFVYLLFPKLIISLLFGTEYAEVSSILFIVGVSFTLISLANIIILYRLSIDKLSKSSFVFLIFVVLQIIGLSLFHTDLLEFSLTFLIVNMAMFIYSLFLIKR